jgi:hypothetical protein
MLMDGIDATSAAYEVGYESQINRGYSRLFGLPQSAISRLRETAKLRPSTRRKAESLLL